MPETGFYSSHAAPVLPFAQQQTATLPTGINTHYYQLEVPTPMALQLDGEIDSELQAAIGSIYKYRHSQSLSLGEPARCFTSGTYVLAIQSWGHTTDLNYSISVSATDRQCVEPTAQTVNNEHPDGDWYVNWSIAADGTTYAMPIFSDSLTAYDQNGEQLWTTSDVNPTSAPDKLSDGSTAVLSYKSLRLLDTTGKFLWTIELDETQFPSPFTGLVGNDDTIVIFNQTEVASFNSHDGSLRWRYSPQDYVTYVKVADNGKVLVHGSEDPDVGIYYLDK